MDGYGMGMVQLTTAPVGSQVAQRITVRVWNRSYDHPNPAKRNSLLSQLSLVALDLNGAEWSTAWVPTYVSSVDAGGADTTQFWTTVGWRSQFQLIGYIEYSDPLDNTRVQWSSTTGLYDERCQDDASCDADRVRSQTLPGQYGACNYLTGPSVFTFEAPSLPPALGVNLRFTRIGGNGGTPDGLGDSTAVEDCRVSFGLDFGP